jgi:hypothetical protein
VLYQLSYTPTGPKRVALIRAVSSIGGALFARVKRPRETANGCAANALFKPPVLRQTSPKPTTRATGEEP